MKIYGWMNHTVKFSSCITILMVFGIGLIAGSSTATLIDGLKQSVQGLLDTLHKEPADRGWTS